MNFFSHKFKNVIQNQYIGYISNISNNSKIKNTFLDYFYNYECFIINNFFVGFMVSEIPRVSLFGNCPYSVTSPIYIKVYMHIYKLKVE